MDVHARAALMFLPRFCRTQVSSLSKFVDETLNRTPNRAAPYVGASAFAQNGGLHVAAPEHSPDSYQVRISRRASSRAARV